MFFVQMLYVYTYMLSFFTELFNTEPFLLQLTFVWDILLLMAKNVNEQDFVSGDRSMSYGRKFLVDGSIAETRRSLNNRDISQESRFFMKKARTILWRELRGTSLKTSKYNFMDIGSILFESCNLL